MAAAAMSAACTWQAGLRLSLGLLSPSALPGLWPAVAVSFHNLPTLTPITQLLPPPLGTRLPNDQEATLFRPSQVAAPARSEEDTAAARCGSKHLYRSLTFPNYPRRSVARSRLSRRSYSATITSDSSSWGNVVPEGRGQTVAVGISGGVDSAVAALMLKERGYKVVGVFMRNWDESEEVGNQNCSVERDFRDAAAVCRQLGVPLHEADFVAKYWTQVFEDFLSQCSRGLTPNPDLACNRHIKFDALLEFADSLGAHMVATGHYARLRPVGPSGSGASSAAGPASMQLLKGADPLKDQTYFLASVEPSSLQRVIFPVGDLCKTVVRQIAAERGLLPAERRSSAGICFIGHCWTDFDCPAGRRNFAEFLSQYIPPVPGTYVSVDSGLSLGTCSNVLTVTHGQRPGIGGAADRVYVVGKDMVDRIVYVCQGRHHPALFTRTALLRSPHWLSASHSQQLAVQGFLRCQYKARYGQDAKDCTLFPATPQLVGLGSAGLAAALMQSTSSAEAGGASSAAPPAPSIPPFQSSTFTRLHPQDSEILPGYLVTHFDDPSQAIAPQQAFVIYEGEVCLGSAVIALPGLTLHEEERRH